MYLFWSIAVLLTWIRSGEKQVDSAIVGGRSARPPQIPYTVSVRQFMKKGEIWKENICSGILIATNSDKYVTVLTSAHSFYEKPMLINIGIGLNVNAQDHFDVEQCIIHPEYDRAIKGVNDVAILTVRKTDTLNRLLSAIEPLILSQFTPPFEMDATVSGFGYHKLHGYNNWIAKPQVLQSLKMPLIAPQSAQVKYELMLEMFGRKMNCERVPLTNDVVCTYSEEGTGPCPGDSGGGLVVNYGNTAILVGITSWSAGFYEEGKSSLHGFMSIAAQYEFLRTHVPGAKWTSEFQITPVASTQSMLLASESGAHPVFENPAAQAWSLLYLAFKTLFRRFIGKRSLKGKQDDDNI